MNNKHVGDITWQTTKMIAERGIVRRYRETSQQLLRISWLAPDIVAAIADGRQPATLTGRRLLRATNIRLSWEAQRKLFGFA